MSRGVVEEFQPGKVAKAGRGDKRKVQARKKSLASSDDRRDLAQRILEYLRAVEDLIAKGCMILMNNGHPADQVRNYPISAIWLLLDNLAEIRGAKQPKKSVHRRSKTRDPNVIREPMSPNMFMKTMMTPPPKCPTGK